MPILSSHSKKKLKYPGSENELAHLFADHDLAAV